MGRRGNPVRIRNEAVTVMMSFHLSQNTYSLVYYQDQPAAPGSLNLRILSYLNGSRIGCHFVRESEAFVDDAAKGGTE